MIPAEDHGNGSKRFFECFSNRAGRKGIAVVLIVAGIYLLANNVFSVLENLGISMSYEMYQILTKNIPQTLVSLLIIGKKRRWRNRRTNI